MKKTALILSFVLVALILPYTAACKAQGENKTYYEICATLNDFSMDAVQTVNYFNDTENCLTFLKFNLFGNAFRKDAKYSPVSEQNKTLSYPNGESYGGMDIKSVNVEGKKVEFFIDGVDKNILTVPLEREVFPDERVKVSIEFTLNLANVIARTGYNEKTINLANFYPVLCVYEDSGFYECVYYSLGDPFYSDCADYLVSLKCNSEYVVAGAGKKTDEKVVDGFITHTFSASGVRSFAMVLSKRFEIITEVLEGVEINYYYYDDIEPKKSIEYATKSISYFSKTFGQYPYSTYSVVQTPFVQGGMEFPTLVMISDDLTEKAYGEVIVHETAHQWWQTAVGNNEIEHGFLDEGLAEYSVVLFYENFSEYGLGRETMVKSAEQTYKVFCTVSDKLFGKVNTVMTRSLKDFSSEYEYVNIAYIKPCIMYDNLRKTVGDDRFFNGLKKYYGEYKFKNATPDHLVGCFEKLGADTNGFFESFFEGKVII